VAVLAVVMPSVKPYSWSSCSARQALAHPSRFCASVSPKAEEVVNPTLGEAMVALLGACERLIEVFARGGLVAHQHLQQTQVD
jgi:hypothetical protein